MLCSLQTLAIPAGAQFSSHPETGDDGQIQPSHLPTLLLPVSSFQTKFYQRGTLGAGGALPLAEQPAALGLHRA